jgi:hypothetical protein
MDYNANEDVLTKVELISVDTEIDLADFKTRIARPFDPNISAHGNSGVYVDNNFNSNVNLSDGNVVILGKGNTVTNGVNALIVGNDQQVTETGITTTNLRVTETINGSPISEILPTYKKYVALLSQSGTNAPTAIILENTIGDIIFNYIAVGVYEAVLVGQFLANKTWVIGGSADISAGTGDFATLDIKRFDDDTITLTTFDNFSPSNNMLFDTSIEIRIYP